MIRIAVSSAAFDAICATLPVGSVGFESEATKQGGRLRHAHNLKRQRLYNVEQTQRRLRGNVWQKGRNMVRFTATEATRKAGLWRGAAARLYTDLSDQRVSGETRLRPPQAHSALKAAADSVRRVEQTETQVSEPDI